MHKVPPLLHCNTLELLTAINDGSGKVKESSKAAFPFSNLVLFLQFFGNNGIRWG